jgi:thioesterase domain-containing protein
VILWRVLPWDPAARPREPGGALWFPRPFQGAARHDDPARYGCLYVAEDAVSAVAEALAAFRGTGDLDPAMLTRMGRALALAELELDDAAALLDLDDPAVLTAERLRPSQVATTERARTRRDAARLHDAHPEVAGLRWWSTLEASWINVTLFDRAAGRLRVRDARYLTQADDVVASAAHFLGLGA